jgi:hypothetical protein
MEQDERAAQVLRFWPRLRREAHDLYREVGTLRGRVRELERALAESERSLAIQRQTNERLTNTETQLRARLRAVESSRGWRSIMLVRGLLRSGRRRRGGSSVAADPASPAPVTIPPRLQREPTFAQKWAAETARRDEAAKRLDAWAESARASRGEAVVIVAGDEADEHSASFIQAALSRGDAVCELEAEETSNGVRGSIPPGIQPSLVPDLLRMETGGKDRVFVCTATGHAAIRWVVPAQQEGWSTALILAHVEPSGALVYLATHADVVIVVTDAAARALEELTGVRARVLPNPSAHDVIEARRSTKPVLPRVVLGIE